MNLEIGLRELHNKEKDEQLNFWGKITGEEGNYYIALGLNYTNHYEFPEKKYYYAPSTFEFKVLPETFPYHDNDFLASYSKPLKGKADIVIHKYKKEVEEGEEEQNEEEQNEAEVEETVEELEAKLEKLDKGEDENENKKEEPKEDFTEELKLSYLVRQIEYDTDVVPAGAFKLIPEHELRVNKCFKGLKPEELKDKRKFLHFRAITDPKKKEFVETDEAIFSVDILDSIENDPVKCSWSIQLDPTKTICNVRSLLWPGYFAVHKSNTNLYGGCYIGNGMKNAELPFMV
jgi:radial spoke head protein 9